MTQSDANAVQFVLDLDGTFWTGEQFWVGGKTSAGQWIDSAYTKALREIGIDMRPGEVITNYPGANPYTITEKIIKPAFERGDVPTRISADEFSQRVRDKADEVRAQYPGILAPIPGAADFLAFLKNGDRPYIFCTNGPSLFCEYSINATALPITKKEIVSAFDEARETPKPNVRPFNLAFQRGHIDRSRVVMVGDTRSDGIGAARLGIPFFGIHGAAHDPAAFRKEHLAAIDKGGLGAIASFRDLTELRQFFQANETPQRRSEWRAKAERNRQLVS